jgi:hypothetical protein
LGGLFLLGGGLAMQQQSWLLAAVAVEVQPLLR